MSPTRGPIEIDLKPAPDTKRTLNVSQGIDHAEIQKMCPPPDAREKMMKQVSIARKEATQEVIIGEDSREADEEWFVDTSKQKAEAAKKKQQSRDEAICNKSVPKKTTFDGRQVDDLGTPDQRF